MDIDQRAIAAPSAKWAASCREVGLIPRYTAEALYRARSGCPGPVYLDVPWDVMDSVAAPLDVATRGFPALPPRPAASPDDIGSALAALRAAERPVIIAGSGVFWSGAGEELRAVLRGCANPRDHRERRARGCCRFASVEPRFAGARRARHSERRLRAGPRVRVQRQHHVRCGTALRSHADDHSSRRRCIAARRQSRGGCRPRRRCATCAPRPVRHPGAAGPRGREEWRDRARSLAHASLGFWDQQVDSFHGERIHAGAVAREIAAFARERLSGDATLVADGGDALAWALAYFHAEKPGRLLDDDRAGNTPAWACLSHSQRSPRDPMSP